MMDCWDEKIERCPRSQGIRVGIPMKRSDGWLPSKGAIQIQLNRTEIARLRPRSLVLSLSWTDGTLRIFEAGPSFICVLVVMGRRPSAADPKKRRERG